MTDAADRNLSRILSDHPGAIEGFLLETELIDKNPIFSKSGKRRHFIRIASQFSEFITPLTPCRNKCSHCCNMATAVSQEEADVIAEFTGRKAVKVIFNVEEYAFRNGYQDIYTGVPCTFLVEGRCSIYEVRPMACRLHHSLEDTPDACKMDSKKEVGVVNIYPIHEAYINATNMMAQGGAIGDIRQFFPPLAVTHTEDHTEGWP